MAGYNELRDGWLRDKNGCPDIMSSKMAGHEKKNLLAGYNELRHGWPRDKHG